MSIKNTAFFQSIMKGVTAAPAILSTPNLELEAAVRDNSPARSTHHCRAQHSCFHTHCGVDTWDIKLASNGRILVRIVFQSQAVTLKAFANASPGF